MSDISDHVAAAMPPVSAHIAAARLKIDAAIETFEPDDAQENEWREPVLFGEIETPKISCELLPATLRDFVKEVSRYTQTPEEMTLMLSIAIVATCTQKRFIVSPFGDDYAEPLNLWVAVAMPPASRKSAVLSLLREPLMNWEKDQAVKNKSSYIEARTERDVMTNRVKELKRKAALEQDATERNRLIAEASEAESALPPEVTEPRLFTSDVTPERLQDLLVQHRECMSVIADEGGIFEVMAGLYTDGKVNIDVFLQAHAGQPVRVDRGGREAHLNSPALSFALAVQPSIIAGLGQGSKSKFRGIGALARFLFCFPKSNIGKRFIGRTDKISATSKAAYHATIHKLLNIECNQIDGIDQPRKLMLSEDAAQSYVTFAKYIEQRHGLNGDLESLQDWTGKLAGAALRIAANFHVWENGGDTLVIGDINMQRAIKICILLIAHTQAAFDLIGCDNVVADAKHIFKWLLEQKQSSCKQSDIQSLGRFKNDKIDRVLAALKILQDRNIIAKQEKLSTRKPTLIYRINPAIIGEGE